MSGLGSSAASSHSYDVVTAQGRHLVKLIGDEVMCTAQEPATAWDISEALCAAAATSN